MIQPDLDWTPLVNARMVGGCSQFQRQMADTFGLGLTVATSEGQRFEAMIDGYAGERLRFASMYFSAHATSSSRSRAEDRRTLVSVHQKGEIVVQQDGRRSRIDPGQMFMLDPSRPFHIETDIIQSVAVFVNSQTLRALLPDVEMLTARAIHTDEGGGAIFRNFLFDLIDRRKSLQEGEANQIAVAIPYLIAATLMPAIDSDRQTTRLRQLHRQRIIVEIERQLCDGTLNASAISASVGLSLRYVHDLFSESGDSLMSFVWRRRVERAHDELILASAAPRSIGEIAFGWGFNHLPHFSRAFRDRYGMSPREYRKRKAKHRHRESLSSPV